MYVDIYTADSMVYNINIEGNALTAKQSMNKLAEEIQQRGYYAYESPRSNRVNIIPYHSITGIEQSNIVMDDPRIRNFDDG